MIKPTYLEHDWFPSPLPRSVTLGERSWCYSSFSCLHFKSEQRGAVRVGHDTGIYNGTFFDLGPRGEVQIGDFCTLVGGIICTNAKVVIENYTFIAHEVVLADSFAAMPFRPQRASAARMITKCAEKIPAKSAGDRRHTLAKFAKPTG